MKHTAWHQKDLPDKGANVAWHFDNSGTIAKPSWKCMAPYCYADFPSGQLLISANDVATYLELMLNKGQTLTLTLTLNPNPNPNPSTKP